jgi:hypothetical protein
MTKHTKFIDVPTDTSYIYCKCGWISTTNSMKLAKKRLDLHKKICNKPIVNNLEEFKSRLCLKPNLPIPEELIRLDNHQKVSKYLENLLIY